MARVIDAMIVAGCPWASSTCWPSFHGPEARDGSVDGLPHSRRNFQAGAHERGCLRREERDTPIHHLLDRTGDPLDSAEFLPQRAHDLFDQKIEPLLELVLDLLHRGTACELRRAVGVALDLFRRYQGCLRAGLDARFCALRKIYVPGGGIWCELLLQEIPGAPDDWTCFFHLFENTFCLVARSCYLHRVACQIEPALEQELEHARRYADAAEEVQYAQACVDQFLVHEVGDAAHAERRIVVPRSG